MELDDGINVVGTWRLGAVFVGIVEGEPVCLKVGDAAGDNTVTPFGLEVGALKGLLLEETGAVDFVELKVVGFAVVSIVGKTDIVGCTVDFTVMGLFEVVDLAVGPVVDFEVGTEDAG